MLDHDAKARHLCLILLRYETGLSQGEFGRLAGIAASQYSQYDRGERPIPRHLLDRAAEAAGFPPLLIDPLLRQIRSFRAAARGWSHTRGVQVGDMFSELLDLLGEAAQAVLDIPEAAPRQEVGPPRAEDREEAARLWRQLWKLTPGQRLAVVEELEEYQSWAVCERVAAASLEEAAGRPAEALGLALLAQRIAELASGPEPWRRRLLGYAGIHVSHARRANQDAPGAEVEFSRAKKLWNEGAQGDPGRLLDSPLLRGLADA